MMIDHDKPYRIYLCGGPRCAPRSMPALLNALELLIWDKELDDRVEVRVGGCQSNCEIGPNMMIYPGPYRYAGLTIDALERILDQHIQHGEPVRELLSTL